MQVVPEQMQQVHYPDIRNQESTVRQLNNLLADEFAVFTKTLNYHWNVRGPRFHSIHVFLGDQYQALLEIMDDVAERAKIIGGDAIGTMSEFSVRKSVTEEPGKTLTTAEMLNNLNTAHITIQEKIRKLLDGETFGKRDPGTEDFLTGLLRKHEEMAWMLRSHVGNQ